LIDMTDVQVGQAAVANCHQFYTKIEERNRKR